MHNLSQVPASAFEVVQMNPVYTAVQRTAGAAPGIASFTATPSTGAGSSVTLSWSVSNASYVIVSPQVGAVRGTSVTVNPAQTTTYTLYATNQFGPQYGDSHRNGAVAIRDCVGRAPSPAAFDLSCRQKIESTRPGNILET